MAFIERFPPQFFTELGVTYLYSMHLQFFTKVGEGLTFRSGGEVDVNVEVVCGEQVVRRRGGGGGRGRGRGEETGVGCGLDSTQGSQLLRGTQR